MERKIENITKLHYKPKPKKHMKKSKKMTVCVYEWITNEMEIAEFYGIPVNVGGVTYTSDDKEELLNVLEDVPYMKEYLDDGRGKITQINFNPVKHE